MRFEWEPSKRIANLEKDQVSFEDARTIFVDEDHSGDEERFTMLGMSSSARLLAAKPRSSVPARLSGPEPEAPDEVAQHCLT